MDHQHRDPLRIFCRNCGAPAFFDIQRQSFACPHCGEVTGVQSFRSELSRWRQLQRDSTVAALSCQDVPLVEYACSTCGARVVFPEGEALETCDFCGSKLLRREFMDPAVLPELIIPFFITPEEARERMLAWGQAHQNTPEGRAVAANVSRLCGYYLPYQLARGPVSAEISRAGTDRRYHCSGFLNGTAVNTSRQFDNLVLNDAEPFDWTGVRPFELGVIAGSRVKFADLSDAETAKRIAEEVTEDFRPEVCRIMQTSGVDIGLKTGDLFVLSALLPVYIIRQGNFTAVMNGQTGRMVASTGRERLTYPWLVEPTVYTLLILVLALCYFAPSEALGLTVVPGIIIFAIFSKNAKMVRRRKVLRSQVSAATRKDGLLTVTEGRDILKNPYDNTPVFFEPGPDGAPVQVRLQFYGFWRILVMIINILITVFLPVFPAALIRLLIMGGEPFMANFRPEYGAAWYVLAAFLVLLYFGKGIRQDVYEHPVIRAVQPDGSLKLIGRLEDRKIGLLNMFLTGKTGADGRPLTLTGFIRELGFQGGCILGGSLLFLLLGSVGAIVTPD